ncbi:MAG: hypothetical protein O9247_00010 [Rhodobacteraceae bacterium]|nr:hypothetical protein [Paracoccaceae bacterium]
MGQSRTFAHGPQQDGPSGQGLRVALRLGATLAALTVATLTLATAARAQNFGNGLDLSKVNLAYIAPTLAACALDDLSMETRRAALVAAGWKETDRPEAIFQRRLSLWLWNKAPSETNRTDTIATVLSDAHDTAVKGYMKGLQDPASARAFLRRDDPTASLVLFRDGDDTPETARSRCDLVTGALDATLLAMADVTERPAALSAQKEWFQKGAPIGDRIMATDISVQISPPDHRIGSITLHAFARLHTNTMASDPAWLDAVMAESE